MNKIRKKISVITIINFVFGIITFPFLSMTTCGFVSNSVEMIIHGSKSQIETTIFQVSILLFIVCLFIVGFFQFLLFKESNKKLKGYIKSDFIGFLIGSIVSLIYFCI